MNFAWETDPIALAVLVMALILGAAAGAATFYFGLEDGLRRRRSPNQVMLEAIAAGVVLAGAVGSFATFGIIYFVGSLIAGVVLLGLARGLTRLTMGLFAVALVLAVLAFLQHKPSHPKASLPPPVAADATGQAPAAPTSPTTPAPVPGPPPPPAAPPAKTPLLHPIAPKDDQPLITPVPASGSAPR